MGIETQNCLAYLGSGNQKVCIDESRQMELARSVVDGTFKLGGDVRYLETRQLNDGRVGLTFYTQHSVGRFLTDRWLKVESTVSPFAKTLDSYIKMASNSEINALKEANGEQVYQLASAPYALIAGVIVVGAIALHCNGSDLETVAPTWVRPGVDGGKTPAEDGGVITPPIDAGKPDGGFDAGTPVTDAGEDAGTSDAGADAGLDAGTPVVDGGEDAGLDAGTPGVDGGEDAGLDAGQPDGGDAGTPDAGGIDSGYGNRPDGGPDGGSATALSMNFCTNLSVNECLDNPDDPNDSYISGLSNAFYSAVMRCGYIYAGNYILNGIPMEEPYLEDFLYNNNEIALTINSNNSQDALPSTLGAELQFKPITEKTVWVGANLVVAECTENDLEQGNCDTFVPGWEGSWRSTSATGVELATINASKWEENISIVFPINYGFGICRAPYFNPCEPDQGHENCEE